MTPQRAKDLDRPFLQTRSWRDFQAALGKTPLGSAGGGWSWSGFVERSGRFRYLYCPAGPVVSDPASLEPALQSIAAVGRSAGAVFARIEPRGCSLTSAVLARAGIREVQSFQPRLSSAVDLTASIDHLTARLSRGHRARIREAERKGIHVRLSSEPADIDHFLAMVRATSARNDFRAHSDAHFRVMARSLLTTDDASLYLAEVGEGSPIASAIVVDTATTRTYVHAAADQDRSRRLHAGPPLVWRTMLDAKCKGLASFDLYGVSPAGDKDHPWSGLSEFKRGFGGSDYETVGTWEVSIRSVTHRVYRAMKWLTRAEAGGRGCSP